MRALVYHGPGSKAWEEVPDPTLVDATDAIVRVDTTTICGTDLHILEGDVPAVTDGRILGHEGVGTVTEVGSAVNSLRVGDQVIISCISACGSCTYCQQQLPSRPGWSARRPPRCCSSWSHRGKLHPEQFVTHRFGLDEVVDAYDTFGRAADTKALKVALAR